MKMTKAKTKTVKYVLRYAVDELEKLWKFINEKNISREDIISINSITSPMPSAFCKYQVVGHEMYFWTTHREDIYTI